MASVSLIRVFGNDGSPTPWRVPNSIVQPGRFPCHAHGQLRRLAPAVRGAHAPPGVHGRSAAPGSAWPVSDACLMVSMKRCRSTAVSNVGMRF